MNISTKKIAAIASGLALSALIAVPAFAQMTNGQQGNNSWQGHGGPRGAQGNPGQGNPDMGGPGIHSGGMVGHGIFGSVTAISGTTLTVTGQQGFGSTTTASVTYTVDASNATVRKAQATSSTISNIAIGDKVMIQGTVTGTSVVATSIFDGIGGQGMRGPQGGRVRTASSTAPFIGNGQPVVAGSVSTISGTTLTVTTAAGTTYTVDASSAKIIQGASTIALSNIVVGNNVIIQGTINGTSVTATTVIDQVAQSSNQGTYQGTNQDSHGQNAPTQKPGFFGGIGSFFKHIFGF